MAKYVVHGNKGLGFAPITNSGGSGAAFGSVTMLPGLVSTESEVEQEDSTIYADDEAYLVSKGARVRNLTVVVRALLEEYAEMLGYVINENGMWTDTGKFPPHCLFFLTTSVDGETGEETQVLHYFYSVVASTPNEESETDEEEITAQEIEIAYTASTSTIAKDEDGNFCQYARITRTAENATWFDTYKTKVLLPTDEVTPTA